MFVVMLSACLIIYYIWSRHQRASTNNMKSIPLYVIFKMLSVKMDLWSRVLVIIKAVQSQGGVVSSYTFDRGVRRRYYLTDPEDSLTVLKACGEKDYVYDYWKPWVGSSTFTGSAQVNKANRKLYSKSFMPNNMDAFFKYFNIHSKRFVEKLSSYHAKDPFDMTQILRLYNLELLCDTVLAYKAKENVELDEYLDAASKYMKMSANRYVKIYTQFDCFFNLTKQKKEYDAVIEVLHETSDKIIRQRRQTLKDIKLKKCEPQDYWVLIDSFIEAADAGVITEETLRAEVDTVIFAGHDTSAYTMLYTLVLLGSHPEVQERAFQEIQNVLGERTDATKDDVSKLVYIEAIIKESMRLFPYVVMLPKRLEKDVALKNCTLAANSSVAVLSWGVHRDKIWGPDAEVFRPERWLEPDKLPKATMQLAFSEGARTCLGRRYAMLSMKTLLFHLIKNFRFTADHTKIRFSYVGVLEPKSGQEVAIERRD